MQQTNQYQLNLLEQTDTFSVTPLNENTEKVEAALAEQAEALTDHAEAIAAGVKIAVGSYTGKGTYGSSNKNSLTFEFEPKLVIVMGDTQFCLFVQGFTKGLGRNNNATGADRYIQTAAWSGNTLTWYITTTNSDSGAYTATAVHQLNTSGTKYYYIAIG